MTFKVPVVKPKTLDCSGQSGLSMKNRVLLLKL